MEQVRAGTRKQCRLVRVWTPVLCVLGRVPWGRRSLVCGDVLWNSHSLGRWWHMLRRVWKAILQRCLVGHSEPGDSSVFLAWLIIIWFILKHVGSFFALCSSALARSYCCWEVLVTSDISWGFRLVLGFVVAGWCKIWNEAGHCHGDPSEFSAAVRGEIRLPRESSNFIVVALGGRLLAGSCARWRMGWVRVGSKWFLAFALRFWSERSPLRFQVQK